MIYDFTIRLKEKSGVIEKQFFLTADSKKDLYRRILNMYRVTQDNITINNVIDEDDIDINKTKTKEKPKRIKAEKVLKNEDKVLKVLNDHIYGYKRQFLIDMKNKSNYNIIEPITLDKYELDDLFTKYDKVKIYYISEGKKKDKQYIALVK